MQNTNIALICFHFSSIFSSLRIKAAPFPIEINRVHCNVLIVSICHRLPIFGQQKIQSKAEFIERDQKFATTKGNAKCHLTLSPHIFWNYSFQCLCCCNCTFPARQRSIQGIIERRSFSCERSMSAAQFFKKERKVSAVRKNWWARAQKVFFFSALFYCFLSVKLFKSRCIKRAVKRARIFFSSKAERERDGVLFLASEHARALVIYSRVHKNESKVLPITEVANFEDLQSSN